MSSDLSHIAAKVTVLTGKSNYRDWAVDLKATAKMGGFWNAYIDKNKAGATATAEEQDRVDQRNMKAEGLLYKTVSQVIRIELDTYRVTDTSVSPPSTCKPTVAEMWKYIQDTYEKKDGVASFIEFKMFLRADLTDDVTLEEQLGRLWELRSHCATNDLNLDDWVFALLTLLALPPSYQHIPDSLLASSNIKDLKPDVVRAKIVETEIRRNGEASSSANAISLSTKPNIKGRGTLPPAGTKCFHCGKEGHWANNCPTKAKEKKKKKKKPNAGPSSSDKDKGSHLNVVETSNAPEFNDSNMFCYFGAPEDWLMDSGTTDHMTPYGSDFTPSSYITFKESRTVILGDGATHLHIYGKGTIERWVETAPHHYNKLTLEDVLHVSGIKRRFLSTGRFFDKGFRIVFDPEGNHVSISKGNFRISGSKVGTLFRYLMYSERPVGAHCLNSVAALPITTWHDRMGHLHWEALKQIRRTSSNPPLLGIKMDQTEPPKHVCEGCQAGKAKRRAFKVSSSDHQAKEPLERIHSDLSGPMEMNSIGGHRFTCVFTDDYSRHVWVFFLKSKDKTLQTFQTFVNNIEKQTGRHIRYFRSDRGGEYMSSDFTMFLEERGITRETSAPHTPQQNGLAERMNQTLQGAARAMLHHSELSKGFWAEATATAAHILNRVPRKNLEWRTPYELFFGRVPEISYFCVFGCCAWVFSDKTRKWDQ